MDNKYNLIFFYVYNIVPYLHYSVYNLKNVTEIAIKSNTKPILLLKVQSVINHR